MAIHMLGVLHRGEVALLVGLGDAERSALPLSVAAVRRGEHELAVRHDQPHAHQKYDGAARIIDVDLGVLDAMNTPPPDQSYMLAARIARRNWEQGFVRAAQMPWLYAVDELPVPALIAGQ
jgi:hypothetical protein